MMGITGRPEARNNRIQVLTNYGVRVMSMGFLTGGEDTPLIWRGPMLHSVIQQFIHQVDWGELDYLLIDLPPGTGDVQLSLTQTVPLMGAVIVTTPQDVALQDARKAIMMFRQVRVEVLGIVENMSYFECPSCHTRSDIFSHGGGRETAERYDVPFSARSRSTWLSGTEATRANRSSCVNPNPSQAALSPRLRPGLPRR